MVVEIVDLVVEGIDQIEVVLGDLVHEVVRHHSRIVDVAALAGLVDGRRVEGLVALRGLAHGQHEVARQDDVDLLVEDLVLARHGNGDEEDAEDVVAVPLEGRPGLVLVLRGCQQPIEGARVQPLRHLLAELGCVGIDEIDPLRPHGVS